MTDKKAKGWMDKYLGPDKSDELWNGAINEHLKSQVVCSDTGESFRNES